MKSYADLCADLVQAAVRFTLAERRHVEAKAELAVVISTPGHRDEAITLARALAKSTHDKREQESAALRALARELTAVLEGESGATVTNVWPGISRHG